MVAAASATPSLTFGRVGMTRRHEHDPRADRRQTEQRQRRDRTAATVSTIANREGDGNLEHQAEAEQRARLTTCNGAARRAGCQQDHPQRDEPGDRVVKDRRHLAAAPDADSGQIAIEAATNVAANHARRRAPSSS